MAFDEKRGVSDVAPYISSNARLLPVALPAIGALWYMLTVTGSTVGVASAFHSFFDGLFSSDHHDITMHLDGMGDRIVETLTYSAFAAVPLMLLYSVTSILRMKV